MPDLGGPRWHKLAWFLGKRLPSAIIGSLILIAIAINFANVIGRKVFASPVPWAEEIMIFIMAWCVFVGAVAVSWDGRHLRMDLFSRTLPAPWKRCVNLVATLALLAFCALMVWYSFDYVKFMFLSGQRSNAANLPMTIPHSAVLIGFSLIFVGVLARFRSHITGDLESEIDDLSEEFGVAESEQEESRAGDT